MKPAQEVCRDGQADLFQQSCTASGVQIGTRWEIRCGGGCQILIGKLPTTGTRCDTAATANVVSDRVARSLHGSPGLLGGPPSAWLPRNLPRQNQGQTQTLPEPLLPTCDLAAWIPNCRILIPSGASIVGQLLPHN